MNDDKKVAAVRHVFGILLLWLAYVFSWRWGLLLLTSAGRDLATVIGFALGSAFTAITVGIYDEMVRENE